MDVRAEVADLEAHVWALTVRVRRDCVAVKRKRALRSDPAWTEAQLRASRLELSRERRRLAALRETSQP